MKTMQRTTIDCDLHKKAPEGFLQRFKTKQLRGEDFDYAERLLASYVRVIEEVKETDAMKDHLEKQYLALQGRPWGDDGNGS